MNELNIFGFGIGHIFVYMYILPFLNAVKCFVEKLYKQHTGLHKMVLTSLKLPSLYPYPISIKFPNPLKHMYNVTLIYYSLNFNI